MEQIKYVKYDNDRAGAYQIRTTIFIDDSTGIEYVRKSALTDQAHRYIENMAELSEKIACAHILGNQLEVCPWKESDGSIIAEYEDANTLERKLDFYLRNEQHETFEAYILKYINLVMAMQTGLLDVLFSNVLCGEEWRVSGSECFFSPAVPVKYIIYRAFKRYFTSREKKYQIDIEKYYIMAKISFEERRKFEDSENTQIKHMLNGHANLEQIRNSINKKVWHITDYIRSIVDNQQKCKIYFDRGMNFSEEDTLVLDWEQEDSYRIETILDISSDILRVRVDPGEEPCLVGNIEVYGSERLPCQETNGMVLNEAYVLFQQTDPQLIYVVPKGTKQLRIRLFIERLA